MEEEMRRRELIVLLGGAVATYPFAVKAQRAATPTIGYLSSFPGDTHQTFMKVFRQALNEAGFVEGRNVTIEYRWVQQGQYDLLPGMAAELVSLGVAVLFASP